MSQGEINKSNRFEVGNLIAISITLLVLGIGAFLVSKLPDWEPFIHLTWLFSTMGLAASWSMRASGRSGIHIFYIYVLRITWIGLLLIALLLAFPIIP
jgi:uncharacterized membrane protein